MVGKRFDLSVEDAICLEKAWGRGLIALAIELGCQLASSDNCFPWQDPVGQEKRSTVWGINAGIHFHPSLVIIVSWARGYLLPICVRAKLWLTPIDQRGQGMQGWREREGCLEGLEYHHDCHSKITSGGERGWWEGERKCIRREEEEGGRKVHDDHDSNVCYFNYPVSVLIVSFLFYYLSFQRINNPTFSLVNYHLHKSIEH